MQDKIVDFLTNTLLVDFDESVTVESNLFELGLIDSYGYVELIAFLESEFAVQISDEDLHSSALSSVNGIVELVTAKQSAAKAA